MDADLAAILSLLCYNERRELRFAFADSKLQALYVDEVGAKRYPPGIVDRFIRVIGAIEAASDEREFYNLKSLHFEALKGRRGQQGQYSMRLNKQYRLIVTVESSDKGRIVVIQAIEDYH